MGDFFLDEPFELPVEYKDGEMMLPARLVRRGYSYKIHVEVNGKEIVFEPDEERNFRAISENATGSVISLDLILAIGEALEKHLR